jgi:hypothetical protein
MGKMGTEIVICLIFAVCGLVSVVVGAIQGNKQLLSKEGSGLSNIYLFWIVAKQTVLAAIVFVIVFLIASNFLKGDVWAFIMCAIYGAINFFYTKSKVIEEWNIMLKPGEGVLTEEGRRKIEERG